MLPAKAIEVNHLGHTTHNTDSRHHFTKKNSPLLRNIKSKVKIVKELLKEYHKIQNVSTLQCGVSCEIVKAIKYNK